MMVEITFRDELVEDFIFTRYNLVNYALMKKVLEGEI